MNILSNNFFIKQKYWQPGSPGCLRLSFFLLVLFFLSQIVSRVSLELEIVVFRLLCKFLPYRDGVPILFHKNPPFKVETVLRLLNYYNMYWDNFKYFYVK